MMSSSCFAATCGLCGNGGYGGLADIYQSSEHGARPTRNLRLPGGDHPAAQRASPSLRIRSRARRGPRVHRSGRLGGARRSGPRKDQVRSRRSRAGAERSHIGMAQEHGYMQWTSREPAGGVMNRLLCCRISDSDGRSLHIAGPGQDAGPRHSGSTGVEGRRPGAVGPGGRRRLTADRADYSH